MIIPFEYKIFENYLAKRITSQDIKLCIMVAFQNAIQNIIHSNTFKYYQLSYFDSDMDTQDLNSDYFKSKVIKSSSILFVYNYFLFNCEDRPFNNCINYWLNNNENSNILNFIYTIENFNEEKKYEKNGIYYIDLVDIFDKFFSQNGAGIKFNLFEVNSPIVELE